MDYQIRQSFESAMVLGREATLALGATTQADDDIAQDVRRRDTERFELELVGGIRAGRTMVLGNTAVPRPEE